MVSLICCNTGMSGLSNVYAQELQTQGMKVHMYMHISCRQTTSTLYNLSMLTQQLQVRIQTAAVIIFSS